MQDFSKILVPLTYLIKKSVIFWWGPDQQSTFETLRQRLCEAPILVLPEGLDDFVVYYLGSDIYGPLDDLMQTYEVLSQVITKLMCLI